MSKNIKSIKINLDIVTKEQTMNLWMILSFFILGILIGYFRIISEKLYKITSILTTGGLILLLSSMGARISTNKTILRNIERIGLQALSIASGCVLGSILLVKLLTYFIPFESTEETQLNRGTEETNLLTFLIAGSIVFGALLGRYMIPTSFLPYLSILTSYALAILLFGIGVNLGWKKSIITKSSFGLKIGLIPLCVAIGSIIGGCITGYLLKLPLNQSMAISAGFGWYSLSAVILTEIHSVELGLLAFLSNVLRELIAILICPIIAKYLGKTASIAPGGATTMDVTLPVIQKSTGDEFVIPAFINGAILSGAVPFLVPFLISL